MTRPRLPIQRSLPFEQWPVIDRAAWAHAMSAPTPFDNARGGAAKLASSTRGEYMGAYGRWLTWLALTQQLDHEEAPGARATRARVERYYEVVEKWLGGYAVAGRLSGLSRVLTLLEPEGDFAWISKAARHVHRRAVPVKCVEDCLQPYERLWQLANDLMDFKVVPKPRVRLQRELCFRDGLIILFLMMSAIRGGNLARIEIGRQLSVSGGRWRLSFPASEMKGKRPFLYSLPNDLARRLEEYLNIHRPVLAARAREGVPAASLWLSNNGKPLRPTDIEHAVSTRTEAAFGTAMTPHNFRHLAATTIAADNPGGVSDIALVLGHASFLTGEAHYNKARQSDALQRLQAVIEARRGSKRPPPLDADRVEDLMATFETSRLQHAPDSTLEGAGAEHQTGYPLLDWR